MLLTISNQTTVTNSTQQETEYFHKIGSFKHTTSELGVLLFVTHQLEDLSYNLFLKAFTSICNLRQQRIQMLKFLMYNGDAMFLVYIQENYIYANKWILIFLLFYTAIIIYYLFILLFRSRPNFNLYTLIIIDDLATGNGNNTYHKR